MNRCSVSRQLASVEFFVECFYSTSSSVNTLFTCIEWMALSADFYFDIFLIVDLVSNTLPQAQITFTVSYCGWIPSLIYYTSFLVYLLNFILKNYSSYTLQLDSILFPQKIVNYFFAGFLLFPHCIAQVNFIGCILILSFYRLRLCFSSIRFGVVADCHFRQFFC